MSQAGHIELDRAVDSIHSGARARHDLGDIDQLVASIRERGLLQPITIAPDGTLLCGARRLEAVRRLGWKQINVWVRSGLSTRLQQLLAEQDDNTLHKPLTATEAAALYRELKQIIAEDAGRRQQATQFGAVTEFGAPSGAADSAAPEHGDTRAQAAQMVTGRNSYSRLEQVGEIQRVAGDPTSPARVREVAAAELAELDADGKVFGHYQRVKMAQTEHDDDLHQLAEHALARVRNEKKPKPRPRAAPFGAGPVKQYSMRAFLLTWEEMSGWVEHYDPAVIGPALTIEQWEQFEATVAATVAFADAVRTARNT